MDASKDARRLKVGDRVRWTEDGCEGTVREVNEFAVKIHWDDEQWAIMPFSDAKAPWGNIARAEAPDAT